MQIVVDTNVVLDALADRQPFAVSAKELLLKVESGAVRASLVATTLTTIFFRLLRF